MFYREVVQSILLYGSDTWVLLETIEKKVEWEHTGFLRHITGKRSQRIVDGKWETPGAEVVWEAVGTQSAMTYIRRWQANVAQWVALRPIFEECVGEEGYKGGWMQEGFLVPPRGNIETTSGHIRRSLKGI